MCRKRCFNGHEISPEQFKDKDEDNYEEDKESEDKESEDEEGEDEGNAEDAKNTEDAEDGQGEFGEENRRSGEREEAKESSERTGVTGSYSCQSTNCAFRNIDTHLARLPAKNDHRLCTHFNAQIRDCIILMVSDDTGTDIQFQRFHNGLERICVSVIGHFYAAKTTARLVVAVSMDSWQCQSNSVPRENVGVKQ